MRKLLMLALLLAPLAGCNNRPDPRERPDFKDTSDPSSVMGTMPSIEKDKGAGPGPGMGP